jgi:hypothetical protein
MVVRDQSRSYETMRRPELSTDAAMTEPNLGAEQRRALEILVSAGQKGVTEAFMFAHGFWREMLEGLVLAGLTAVVTEPIRKRSPTIEVKRYRITAAGLRALKG